MYLVLGSTRGYVKDCCKICKCRVVSSGVVFGSPVTVTIAVSFPPPLGQGAGSKFPDWIIMSSIDLLGNLTTIRVLIIIWSS
jgi:hypothetical protein